VGTCARPGLAVPARRTADAVTGAPRRGSGPWRPPHQLRHGRRRPWGPNGRFRGRGRPWRGRGRRLDLDARLRGGVRVRTRVERSLRRREIDDRIGRCGQRGRQRAHRPSVTSAGRRRSRRDDDGREGLGREPRWLSRGPSRRRGDKGKGREGQRQDQRGDEPAPQGFAPRTDSRSGRTRAGVGIRGWSSCSPVSDAA
jgi:hypothetical protein